MINSKLKNRNLNQVNVFNFSELFKLMKPRVMSLVIFTCAVGLLMAPSTVSTKDAMIAILLVSIGAGAAGALNMWYESDLDALMTRTCLRPIPMGKVNKNQALIFGTSLSFFSVIALDYFANTISAVLLLFTILFYVFVYTIWLKRKTPQNIVIGGAAGALPPVIGWTIATNSLSLEPITFFLIIFFWTPSHFWALSLYKSDDYKKNIEERLVKAYTKIRTNVKNGLAIVPIERGASGGSYFTIPPQVQMEIASRKKIITDEHSGRILVDAALAEEQKIKMEKLISKL
mgnify:CR=1 FL=1